MAFSHTPAIWFASGKRLTVNGTLKAVGTASNPVVFTSFTDDEYGGDSNGDGAVNVQDLLLVLENWT